MQSNNFLAIPALLDNTFFVLMEIVKFPYLKRET